MPIWPWESTLPTPMQAQWRLRPFDSIVGSSFSPVEEVARRRGVWVCRMAWPDSLRHDVYHRLAGFFGAEGFDRVISVRNFQYRNVMGNVTGTITASGTSPAGSNTITITAKTGTNPLLETGDFVEVPGPAGEARLHRATRQLLSGITVIRVEPFLVADIPGGTQIVHRGDRYLECTMRKVDPESVGVALVPGPRAPGFEVAFVEIIRPSY